MTAERNAGLTDPSRVAPLDHWRVTLNKGGNCRAPYCLTAAECYGNGCTITLSAKVLGDE